MATSHHSVAIVIGSTRSPRIGPSVAEIVKNMVEVSAQINGVTLSIVDVANFNLPVFNEPSPPALVPQMASHKYEHSKAWSAEIARHDAYIWVIPEYNGGMAGATKNCVDYLYNEWQSKPAMVVGYGIKGGKWAGEQLQKTLDIMKLRVVKLLPCLSFSGGGTESDLTSAMKGEVGAASRKQWIEEEARVVQEAFGELCDLLSQPPS